MEADMVHDHAIRIVTWQPLLIPHHSKRGLSAIRHLETCWTAALVKLWEVSTVPSSEI